MGFLQLRLHLSVIKDAGKLLLPQQSCLGPVHGQIRAQNGLFTQYLGRPCCLLQQVTYPDNPNLPLLYAFWHKPNI